MKCRIVFYSMNFWPKKEHQSPSRQRMVRLFSIIMCTLMKEVLVNGDWYSLKNGRLQRNFNSLLYWCLQLIRLEQRWFLIISSINLNHRSATIVWFWWEVVVQLKHLVFWCMPINSIKRRCFSKESIFPQLLYHLISRLLLKQNVISKLVRILPPHRIKWWQSSLMIFPCPLSINGVIKSLSK